MSDKSPIKNIKPKINVKNNLNDNNMSSLTEKIKNKKVKSSIKKYTNSKSNSKVTNSVINCNVNNSNTIDTSKLYKDIFSQAQIKNREIKTRS